jgi:hypothetical protein
LFSKRLQRPRHKADRNHLFEDIQCLVALLACYLSRGLVCPDSVKKPIPYAPPGESHIKCRVNRIHPGRLADLTLDLDVNPKLPNRQSYRFRAISTKYNIRLIYPSRLRQ